jgi:NCS1 family nucleobase:cation symporter-1
VVAASFFTLGLASWQVLLCLLVGICIVQLCANLVAKPSQMAGVPYAVISRQAFGVFGANIPAVIRGLIAFAWYGIQTYLAANALMLVLLKFWPSLATLPQHVPGPVASRLDLLRHHVGAAGDGLLARHERHQALY